MSAHHYHVAFWLLSFVTLVNALHLDWAIARLNRLEGDE